MYVQYKVNVSENQVDTLKDTIRLKKGATLCVPKGGVRGDHVLLLTPVQINRLDKTQTEGRRAQIRMSARHVAKKVSYTGGFIAALAQLLARATPFAARVLPPVMPGLATGLLSGGFHKGISGNGAIGDGLYLHKHGKCYRVQKVKGNGLYLAPHPPFLSKVMDSSWNMVVISVMALVCSWERIVRLRIFPFWDGYCNYLYIEKMYIKAVFILSV